MQAQLQINRGGVTADVPVNDYLLHALLCNREQGKCSPHAELHPRHWHCPPFTNSALRTRL